MAPVKKASTTQNKNLDNTGVIVFFVVIMSIITIASTWLMINGGKIGSYVIPGKGDISQIVKDEILANEYTKVGGKENYDIIQKVQLEQINQYVAQIKAQGGGDTQVQDSGNQVQETSGVEEIKNKLEVFIMAYCPFGEIAMKQVPAVFKQFQNSGLDFDIHYIATKTGEGFQAADFDSLHGVTEAEEDIRQLCIKRDYGVEKLVDYMMVRYENANNYGEVSEGPGKAIEAISGDFDAIENCVTNGEGGRLLTEDIKRATDYNINGSPTWLANNKYKFGGIVGKQVATDFCKYNSGLEDCEEIKIEDNSSNPNSVPTCN